MRETRFRSAPLKLVFHQAYRFLDQLIDIDNFQLVGRRSKQAAGIVDDFACPLAVADHPFRRASRGG